VRVFRFWWVFGLLGLAGLALAASHVIRQDAAWGLHAGLWGLIGLTNLGQSVAGRHQWRHRSPDVQQGGKVDLQG
jgi:hypothetical protein